MKKRQCLRQVSDTVSNSKACPTQLFLFVFLKVKYAHGVILLEKRMYELEGKVYIDAVNPFKQKNQNLM